MFRQISNQESNQQDKSIPKQKFEEVVDAILAGKYSWACVLILRAGGYNPLYYIPYRTYIRLIKRNCLKKGKANQQQQQKSLISISKKT
jgi:hypothetical protein